MSNPHGQVPLATYAEQPYYLEIAQGMVPTGKNRPSVLKNHYTRLDFAMADAIDLAKKYECHVLLMQTRYSGKDRNDIRWCKVSP